MAKRSILVQLDSDPQASVFDAVVALDADVDELLRHSSVEVLHVRDLVYGAIFTRGGDDLKRTAIFIGGSNVGQGEELLKAVQSTFFGSMRVSVMLDSNGANTTAAAAVLAAARHVELKGATALVLAATGPVGSRAVRLLAEQGARVGVASRTLKKAEEVCRATKSRLKAADITPVQSASSTETRVALEGVQIVIAAGAPGVELLPAELQKQSKSLKVAIDLSAVPPLGLAAVEVTDKAKERDGTICYGALGIGGTKMKIHRAAIQRLFTASDLVLDAEQIFQIGREIGA